MYSHAKTMPLSKPVDKTQAYFQCLGILFYPWLLSREPGRWEEEGKPILVLVIQACAQALGTQSRGQGWREDLGGGAE